MKRKGKRIVAGLVAVVVAAGLAFLGVCVWIDGNTGFGAALITVGAIVFLGWISSVIDRRRKAKKA